ncbi:probable serine/threonine-protein kinase KIN4 [Rhynchosporium agropyri]|uniref:non-specific serine/threonine protein kinase n=1 Tax=Rhynchosporium agropyri TaxID=914238 RepID=A0A1E1KRI6_9HELO|nr:probable serine/threonine-protein kinase KIN4 [Rhynchosporium agropyri]
MSSAALQAAPHQPTSVGSHSPDAAISGRPYTAGSSQSRDGYYNQQLAANASPSSTRRSSKRPSGNGASANNSTSQQHHLPSGNNPNPTSMTSRGASSNPMSSAEESAPSGYQTMSPGDHQRGVPPVVSARTSSNRTAAQAAAATAERSRRAAHANETSNTFRQATTGNGQEREGQRSNGNTQGNGEDPAVAAASAATRRKRAQQSPEGIPQRPSGSREPRTSQPATSSQRAAMAAVQSPSGPSREASAVLNRVVVSQPEVDIERERERMAEAIPSSPGTTHSTPGALSVVGTEGVDDQARGNRTRHDHSTTKREKNTKFGDYYLGNTLGEGEFGKVKMGWKQEGGVQVAIKLIRRDTVGTNPTRLAKIYREIAILREISHPNIVRLHEMVETEKQIGIILEYASGGELFDYILNHRYLKDNAARRLFAQLVSGVGYLHKKGIVHRDLKLENLLLDRNRNIIITDFGFANTFNPDDELGDEIEYNLASRDYVKRKELDKVLPGGHRRGDLMQTSCGSPCYAAPELVVSDSLYTGRKVDVWSCGVILYAMLAGYLPFDDDPANPEGDNINLLYKYIVSTPLTFPEYVTPHARDLLRRILVPDPRKRADLFEVARHSWLSEYSHVVGFITSTTTTTEQIRTTAVGNDDQQDGPSLNRSASVREASKTQKSPTAVGDLSRKHGNVDPDVPESYPKPNKDNKRRTVQVEYVAPKSQTQRGEPTAGPPSVSRTRARAGSSGPVEVQSSQQTRRTASVEKPLPQDPPSREQYASQGRRGSNSSRQQGMPPPSRPERQVSRSASDANDVAAHAPPPVSIGRPNTGGSMTSSGSRPGSLALRDRGSYSQPAAPAVAGTNAQGRMSQPKTTKGYNISAPMTEGDQDYGRQSSTQVPPKFSKVTGLHDGTSGTSQGTSGTSQEFKTHKRSNTIGSIFGRTNSLFGGKRDQDKTSEKPKKSYPPVSMSGVVGQAQGQQDVPRQSMDSRRSISFGFGKKRSGSINRSQTTLQGEKSKRFSLLPAGFSLKSIGIGKDSPQPQDDQYDDRPDTHGTYHDTSRNTDSRNVSGASSDQHANDGAYDHGEVRGTNNTTSLAQKRYTSQGQGQPDPRTGGGQFLPPMNFQQGESTLNTESETSLNDLPQSQPQRRGPYPPGFGSYDDTSANRQAPQTSRSENQNQGRLGRGVLQKNNRKFGDAYEAEQGNGYGAAHNDHAGSSGAARKVMDFFRRRGKDRGGQ